MNNGFALQIIMLFISNIDIKAKKYVIEKLKLDSAVEIILLFVVYIEARI